MCLELSRKKRDDAFKKKKRVEAYQRKKGRTSMCLELSKKKSGNHFIAYWQSTNSNQCT